MKDVLDRIAEIRKSKKISQKEIGEKLGISQAAYAKLESGSSITVDRLYKIAEILRVSVSYLLEIEQTSGKDLESLRIDLDHFKKRTIELERQLDNSSRLIDFLSKSEALFDVAYRLYWNEVQEKGHLNSNEPKWLDTGRFHKPFSNEEMQSMNEYVIRRIDELTKKEGD